MAARYHVNAQGNPGVCKAQKSCPFGGEQDHYDSRESAMAAYETIMNSQLIGKSLSKPQVFNDKVLAKANSFSGNTTRAATGGEVKVLERKEKRAAPNYKSELSLRARSILAEAF